MMSHRGGGCDISLEIPKDLKLRRLFINANWAHLIDPRQYDPSHFRGYTQIPATQYKNAEEQQVAVSNIVNAILGAVRDLSRADFAAFEWSVNEITDNVLTHAESPIGGLIQVSTFQRDKKIVQYIVADAGRGIPATLRHTHPQFTSDIEALERAIREGVTRDASIGQGNGLFGSYQICSHCKGRFQVESGHAKLTYSDRDGLQVRNENIPFAGTLVVASIDFSEPGLLEEALKFGGEQYTPTDFVETHYEVSDSKQIIFILSDEAVSFGTRPAGTPIRNRLSNLVSMARGSKVVVNFRDVPLVSSSFADEVFGKLFVEIGPLSFMQSFEFQEISPTVRKLIDRAISQRMSGSRE
jgi:anti-sigma regulatory factor (Ser/Thr protein kinase)